MVRRNPELTHCAPPPVEGWLGLQWYKLYSYANGFFQLLAEDAFQMWRLKIHGNVGQGQDSPSPPGPLLLWLGIKKAHKGEWALSAAQPPASVPGGAGQIRRTNLQWQKRFRRHWDWEMLSNNIDFQNMLMSPPISISTTGVWGRSKKVSS